MSGELRLEGPRITTLVTSLAALAEGAPTTEFAVIGGLAVLARLEGAHRVTDDLDTVATQHGDEPTAVEAVVAADGVDGLLGGTKIDCIAVGDVPAAEGEFKWSSQQRGCWGRTVDVAWLRRGWPVRESCGAGR